MQQPETRFTNVGDDRVAYQVFGDGPHDLVASGGQWSNIDIEWENPTVARFYRRLASFSRLIRFDPRGSGLSDARPDDGLGLAEHWAEDLLAVMETVSSSRVHILTWIDGGPLALRFAATHPGRTASLMLGNTTARYMAAPDYPEGHPQAAMDGYLAFTKKHFGDEQWSMSSNPSIAGNEEALRWMAKICRAFGTPKSAAKAFENQQKMDSRSVLPMINTPTLVMGRKNSLLTPVAQGRYIADHVKTARFVEIPGTDQMLVFDHPEIILDLVEEHVTGQRGGGTAERILTSLLFADIVGSTEMAARLGNSQWRELLDRYHKTLSQQVALFGGKVLDLSGDGALSIFDHPGTAIDCAQALIKATTDLDIEIRIGIHFGEVEKRDDDGVGGVNVHVGARVMAEASAGEVLVSQTVQNILLGSKHNFVERGKHRLKGVPGKWSLFAVDADD